MLETRFRPQVQVLESQMYTMKVLHILDSSPGLPRFRGVVRDRCGLVVGFLNDLPSRGWFARLLIKNKTDRAYREKWCRQITEITAAFHRQALVVGMLGGQTDPPIAVDNEDRVVLLSMFRENLMYDSTCLGTLPPECRPYTDGMRATFQTDLYQLGLVLWRIAGNRMGGVRNQFCRAATCTTSPSTVCQEPHTDPTALHMPGDEYSDHMRRIIEICRAEDPKDRIPAHDLLRMFPPVSADSGDRSQTFDHGVPTYHARPDTYQQLYSNETTCERCGRDCSDHHFRCCLCNPGRGRFDLCSSCFREGLHCHDDSHFLRACNWHDDTDDMFYTNVKESGRREVEMLEGLDLRLLSHDVTRHN